MGKRNKKKDSSTGPIAVPVGNPLASVNQKKIFFLYLLLTFISILSYHNTLDNDYCLDDTMLITKNSITKKGFEGIREQVSHSFLYGYMNKEGADIASNHWRPVPMISYSIEVGIWGNNNPAASHVINLLIYLGIVLLFFRLLYKYLFKDTWLSFFTALIYTIHPIHTEVVANIKGRDEMLCLLFLLLSVNLLWKSIVQKKTLYYIVSLLLFFISLASKENSLTFLAGIPLMLYFFSELGSKKICMYSGGFIIVAILFFVVRNTIIPLSNSEPANDILNNPYLYAIGPEAVCTKLYILLLYLKLLAFPHPLTHDYSYNQIPYVNEHNPWVWISLLLYLALFVYAIAGLKLKRLSSFAILMFMISFSVGTNLILETGVLMAERMLFIPSAFAVMLLTIPGKWIVESVEKKMGINRITGTAILIIPLSIVCIIKVISRNYEWKDDNSLTLADIGKSPGSAMMNSRAGEVYIRLSDDPVIKKSQKDSLLQISVTYLKRSIGIYPDYINANLNIAIAYSRLDSITKTEEYSNITRKMDPQNRTLAELDQYLVGTYYNKGIASINNKQPDSAIFYLKKTDIYSRENDSLRMSALYHLAGQYYGKSDYKTAKDLLSRILIINPGHADARKGYEACEYLLKPEEKNPK